PAGLCSRLDASVPLSFARGGLSNRHVLFRELLVSPELPAWNRRVSARRVSKRAGSRSELAADQQLRCLCERLCRELVRARALPGFQGVRHRREGYEHVALRVVGREGANA